MARIFGPWLDRPSTAWQVGGVVLLVALLVTGGLVWHSEVDLRAQMRTQVEHLAGTHAAAIQRNVERALSSTYPVAALLRHNGGHLDKFDELARQLLPYYEGASGLALAPDGVIRQIVPLRGNEAAVGHDLLKDPERDKEALRARDTGKLTLAGPFTLVQGGVAAAGRLPVYLAENGDGKRFWGFVSVLIRFPESLKSADLDRLAQTGHAFELWRPHPDSGQRIVIASGGGALKDAVDLPIAVPNATWYLSVSPVAGWHANSVLPLSATLALLMSTVLAALAAATLRLRQHGKVLEARVAVRTAELHDSEQRYRSYIDSAPTSIFVADAEGRYIAVNPAACALTGYTREELLAKTVPELWPADEAERNRAVYTQHQRAGSADAEVVLQHKDGSKVWVALKGVALPTGHLLAFVTDITARRQAEAQMREAFVVFNSSSQGIMTTDASGVITAINPAFSAITGYAEHEVLGSRSSVFKSGRHDDAFFESMWHTLAASGRWEGEIWNRRKNGELYPQWLTISAVHDAQGQVVEHVAMFDDITERKQHEEAMWRQANFDSLTGLANRNLLADRLERAIAQARRNNKKIGLIFLDLDGFKWINDTLGHAVGDELLVEVARRLKDCVREQDTAARLGGDEFTAVIHDLAHAEDLIGIGETVVGALRKPVLLAGKEHLITGSVGITVYPDDGEDVQTLLKNADIAMYKAKQAGKNRYQFYARYMQVDAQLRMQVEADLRTALAEQRFVLHYQPIVDAHSGALVGAEALIRWQHPDKGLISPLQFIPVAEDSGLIVPIGTWVLRAAVAQWSAWRAQGYPALRLSVNVSSLQFREGNLSQVVADLLEEYTVDAGALILEITESVLMESSQATESCMHELKAMSVGYALDDFGTGYSSLSYLKRFPVDVVKIDRSFVNDCAQDRNDANLVEAIINMAHSLGLRVTAEGVETQAQLEFLRGRQCDFLQGYLIGRPQPADEFEGLLRRGRLLSPTDDTPPESGYFLSALQQDELDSHGS